MESIQRTRNRLIRTKPSPLALEARIMFDAAVGATIDSTRETAAASELAAAAKETSGTAKTSTVERAPAAVEGASAATRTEILFIDSGVSDWQTLAAQARPGVEVIVLDHERDGLQQMLEALRGREEVGAIHIISHGAAGEVRLGATVLNGDTIDSLRGGLQELGRSLASGADILIYGCDVAQGDKGEQLIEAISSATGADVAASKDLTGDSAMGGNWTLEARTGSIEAGNAVSMLGVSGYHHLLTGTSFSLSSTTGWSTVPLTDPQQDQQTGSYSSDIVGNSTYSAFFIAYDGTYLGYRIRVNAKSSGSGTSFGDFAWIGIDADGSGSIDAFVGVYNPTGNNGRIGIYASDPNKTNISPSTTGIDSIQTTYTPSSGSNFDFSSVQSVTGTSTGASEFSTGTNGDTDYFITFKIKFTDLQSYFSGISISITESTALRYIVGTAQQDNAFNCDVGGITGAYASSTTTWSNLGAFAASVSAAGTDSYTGSNSAPTASNTSISTNEDTAKTGTLPTATDSDGDTVTYSKATDPSHGTVTVGSGGSYTYTPTSNYNGSDSFTYTVSDGNGGSNTYTVSVTVNAVNDAPTASNTSVTTVMDTAKTSTLPTASDVDGDSVTYSKATDPSHGTVTVGSGGSYTYTPTSSYTGTDSFTYTVSDGNGGSNTYTVSITVNASNSAPTASNTSISTNEDTAKTGTLPTATDSDGDTVTYSKATDPSHGTVTVGSGGSYTYTPTSNYNGSDSFTYTVSDGNGGSNTYTVSVTVNAVNDAPTASNTSVSTGFNTAKTGTLPTASDVDGDSVTYAKATDPSHGTVTVGSGGSYTYTPTSGYSGSDSFTYTVSDGNGGSNTYTVTVTVATNSFPTASNTSVSTNEDTALTGSLPSATDADGDTVTYAKESSPSHGTVTVNSDGSYTYTPEKNYHGSDSFTYTVSDGNGGSNTYTASITVNPVNDAPTASDTSISTGFNKPKSGNLPTATDVEGDSVTYAKGSDPGHGTVTVNSDGSYTYTPDKNYSGSDSFTYTVSDGNGGTTTYTVSITVAANTAPKAADASASTNEDTALTGSLPAATDLEGDKVSYAKGSDPGHGTVTVNSDGSYTYTPEKNYHGSDGFTYTVSDGNGGSSTYTVSITVNPVNDVPTASDTSESTNGGTPLTGTLPSASDADGDKVTYAKGSDPSHGTVTVNSDGSYTYTPATGYSGSDSFTYTINDGNGGSSTYTVSITVNPVPVITPVVTQTVQTPAITVQTPTSAVQTVTPAVTITQTVAPTPATPTVVAPVVVTDTRAPVTTVTASVSDTANQIAATPGSTVGNDSVKATYGRGTTSTDVPPEVVLRQSAELSDVYTRSEGFRTVVAKSDDPALVLFRGVPDQYTESGKRLSVVVPSDAFAHTQPKEVVRLAATQADGRPLPGWVTFNTQTGQFTGDVPPGTVGELRVKIIARDMQGREATALFRINVGNVKQNGKTDGAKPQGKVGLSEQLRQQTWSSRHVEHSATVSTVRQTA